MRIDETNIKPVFIIGKNRSGTKWLSNLISNSPQIAALRREEDYGIVETNLFYQFPKIFGDLNDYNNYVPFIESFSNTNIFKLTGFEKEILYTFNERNYFRLFRSLMNKYANSNSQKFWLQKSDTHILKEGIEYFPNSLVVIIERNMVDNIRSTIGLQRSMEGNEKKHLLKNAYLYVLEYKRVRRFLKKSNHNNTNHKILFIKYKNLLNDTDNTLKKIFSKIGVEFTNDILASNYKRNTSYKKNISKEKILNKKNILFLKILFLLIRNIPYEILEFIYSRFSSGQTKIGFIPKTFEMRYNEIKKYHNI
jgi:hypothetical protein